MYVSVFTNGSKSDAGIGFGAVLPDSTFWNFACPSLNFSAELLAIQQSSLWPWVVLQSSTQNHRQLCLQWEILKAPTLFRSVYFTGSG